MDLKPIYITRSEYSLLQAKQIPDLYENIKFFDVCQFFLFSKAKLDYEVSLEKGNLIISSNKLYHLNTTPF